MATIRFILSASGGERPSISARLRINDNRKVQAKINGLLAYRKYWSNAKQTHNTKFVNPVILGEVNFINKALADISAHVLARFAESPVELIGKTWLSQEIDDVLHPNKEKSEGRIMLLSLIDDFIAGAPTRIMPRKGKPVSAQTISQYTQTRNLMGRYLSKMKMRDIPVDNLDKPFYDAFVAYLYNSGMKPNTIGKHIKHLKTFINSLPLAAKSSVELVGGGKCPTITEEVDSIYLTEDELGKIQGCIMPTKKLEQVRDQFILLAWTGCRYSDLSKLSEVNIHTMNGGKYFKLVQRKTNTKVTIPILPAAMSVLEKYEFNPPKPMPNQKFNSYIKKVCKISGLEDDVTITQSEVVRGVPNRVAVRKKKWECVTAHTARRSFATNLYKRNFPTLMIMAITGHKTEKAFLTYIKVSDDENAERMMEKFMEQLKLELKKIKKSE